VAADSPVIIRNCRRGEETKPLAYLPIPKEGHPFLLVTRDCVGREPSGPPPPQLRSLLTAFRSSGRCHHVRDDRNVADCVKLEAILAEEAQFTRIPSTLRIMVEIPVSCCQAEVFAQEADFFSIGTNGSTPYTLAMDRGHPKSLTKLMR